MKITRFCGRDRSDIYCVLIQDNWELGMAEGLAHWNGASWRWLSRLEHEFTQDIRFSNGRVSILDADGAISFFYNGELAYKQLGPAYHPSLHPVGTVGALTFYSLEYLRDGTIVIVGDYGLVYVLRDSGWVRIPISSDSRLSDVRAYSSGCYIGGRNGTLLRFDGEHIERIEMHKSDDVLSVDVGLDNAAYALISRGEEFAFARFDESGVVADYPMGRDVFAMTVLSQDRIVFSDYDGVFLWKGESNEQQLLKGSSPQIGKIGNEIALSRDRTGNAAILIDHTNWQKIEIDLDEAYLD